MDKVKYFINALNEIIADLIKLSDTLDKLCKSLITLVGTLAILKWLMGTL